MIRTNADDVNGKQIDDKVNKEITFYELRDKFYPVAPTFSWNMLWYVRSVTFRRLLSSVKHFLVSRNSANIHKYLYSNVFDRI